MYQEHRTQGESPRNADEADGKRGGEVGGGGEGGRASLAYSVSHLDPLETSDLASDWLIQTCCKRMRTTKKPPLFRREKI